MVISRELEVEILRLYHAERWSIGTIAAQLRIHHSTVRRVLKQAGVLLPATAARLSMVDSYKGFIVQTLTQYPSLRSSRLYAMARERGYRGSADHFRHRVALLRPRPTAEAYLRLRTLPGEQAQCDWAHFGSLKVGRAQRPLMAFVMVLSYSRMIFLRFYLGAAMNEFIRGHVEGFGRLGVARILLYDNLKSAVLERIGDAIHFHPTLLELAAHYHFQPRPVALARGNEKGRVERAIRFARDAFFAARTFHDLDDLNAQAQAWCEGAAAQRPGPEDRQRSVYDLWLEEQPHLLALPENPFPSEQRLEVQIHKTPYARFDLNDYSVPHTHVRRTVTVLATQHSVRILDGLEVIARHPRSYDSGAQIEIAAHIQALVDQKHGARRHRAQDRLHYATPSAKSLFLRAAQRGAHLGSLTRGLVELLDSHGAEAVEAAIVAALAEDAAHLTAVRHFADLHAHARGLAPPIAIRLPEGSEIGRVSVRPHALSDYEHLDRENPDDPADTDA